MVVDAGVALIHSSQILPIDDQGRVVPDDQQIETVLNRLDAALQHAGSGLNRVVKLHVALAKAEWHPKVREAFAKRIPDRDGPAWNVVVGELARPGALVAIDAVATTDAKPAPGRVERTVVPGLPGQSPGATLAVLPAGARVNISGQAETDDDLATATRKTLESLDDSLKHIGLGKEHVVQVKAFFLPMKSAEIVEQEVARFFGDATAPPLVMVDWKSSPSQPIEIELIASAPEPGGAEAVEYLSTPWLKPSPVFSRIVRVNHGDLAYVSGLVGPEGASGVGQVEAIFADLNAILAEAGSDLRHLAKATYYVSDDDASQALNTLRPRYYDPARPPAASKAVVPGVGHIGRSVSVDMIAVSAGSKP